MKPVTILWLPIIHIAKDAGSVLKNARAKGLK